MMGEVLNDGNRRQRLEALAAGGSAGVQAYEAAQAAAQQQRSEAIQGTLAQHAWHPGNAAQADPLRELVEKRTAPFVRDAELATDLGREQVGHDAGGREGYLRLGRRDIAAMLTDWERSRELAQQRVASASSGGGGGDEGGGYGGSGLSRTELLDMLRGAGELGQMQERRALDDVAGKVVDKVALAEKVMRDSVRADAENNKGWKKLGARLGNVVEHAGITGRTRAMQRMMEEGYGQKDQSIMLDKERFSREAAAKVGLDPLLAWGLFPDDPGAQVSRFGERRSLADLQRLGNPDGVSGLASDMAAENKYAALQLGNLHQLPTAQVNAIANTFRIDPKNPEAFGTQLARLHELDKTVQLALGEGQTIQEVLTALLAVDDPISADELRYIQQRWGSTFANFDLDEY
jgi:hypothetical protein